MIAFCFSSGTPCKTQKGIENHVKSRPKCLHDLGIAHAVSLGLSLPLSSSQPIDHHLFRFETDNNLAAERSVEVMWHDENAFEAASSMPDSLSKFRKGYSATSHQQTAHNSSVLIEYRCGTKKIDMIFDENDASRPLRDLLIDKLPAKKPAAPSLSLFQIQRIQSFMLSASEDLSSADQSSLSGDGVDFVVAPPLVDADPPNYDVDVAEEEEHIFEQAKVYTDCGNIFHQQRNTFNSSYWHHAGHWSAFENLWKNCCSIQGCEYGTRSHYYHLPALAHSHEPFLSTILHGRAVSHCYDPAKSRKRSFLPSPYSQCSGHD
jgi:hypothetical protein